MLCKCKITFFFSTSINNGEVQALSELTIQTTFKSAAGSIYIHKIHTKICSLYFYCVRQSTNGHAFSNSSAVLTLTVRWPQTAGIGADDGRGLGNVRQQTHIFVIPLSATVGIKIFLILFE